MDQRGTQPNPFAMAVVLMVAIGVMLMALSAISPPQPQPAPQPVAPVEVEEEAEAEGEAKGVTIPTDPLPANLDAIQGYRPNPRATQEFLRTLDKPYIRDAGPDLFDARGPPRAKTPVFLYRALAEAYQATYGRPWKPHRQEIGDCVSHGWGIGVDTKLAVDWKLGETSEFRESCTEAIYGGSRVEAHGSPGDGARAYGGWGDGSYGGSAAKFVSQWGVVFRQPYPEIDLDLSQYDGQRAKQWGAYGCGGKGDGERCDAEAKKHPITSVALVRSFDEAAAAIASGYPVPVCSGQGFSSQRDKDGFCAPRGSWSHCMCFVAVRYEPRPGLLCQNSWGNYVGGPKWPDDQPDGSFWVDANTCTSMLRGGDSFAVSGYHGFPARKLDHGDWIGVVPPRRKFLEVSEPVYALAP